jgi:long-subunit fatty acid transport protein
VEASPTRYSLINMRGSLLASLTAGLAYHGIKGLSIGADVQVVTGRFKAKTALTGCDAFACAFPEDPDFDSIVTLDLFPAIAVSGAAGITYEIGKLRLGASVTFPYTLKGDAHIDIKLPTSPLFENASVKGDTAAVEIKFPWIYRVGAEIRPVEFFRMEGAFVYEAWSTQQEISVVPKNVSMQNIRGIGNYDVGPTAIPRDMRDAWSVRGGYELFVPPRWMVAGLNLVMRGGLAYEHGAFANNALAPLTLDTNKWVISGGLGIELLEGVRIDGVAGWMIMQNVEVRNSEVRQPVAIRPASADRTVIANGNYRQEAIYIGGSLYFDLD